MPPRVCTCVFGVGWRGRISRSGWPTAYGCQRALRTTGSTGEERVGTHAPRRHAGRGRGLLRPPPSRCVVAAFGDTTEPRCARSERGGALGGAEVGGDAHDRALHLPPEAPAKGWVAGGSGVIFAWRNLCIWSSLFCFGGLISTGGAVVSGDADDRAFHHESQKPALAGMAEMCFSLLVCADVEFFGAVS